MGLPLPPPLLQTVKFFIYGAILLKFETEHFHMFANSNRDKDLYIFIYKYCILFINSVVKSATKCNGCNNTKKTTPVNARASERIEVHRVEYVLHQREYLVVHNC